MRVPKAPSVACNTTFRVLIQNATSLDILGIPDRVAFEVLLPLAENQLQGGRSAHAALGGQLLQALMPYVKPGVRIKPPAECFTLLRSPGPGMHLLQPTLKGFTSCWLLFSLPTAACRAHMFSAIQHLLCKPTVGPLAPCMPASACLLLAHPSVLGSAAALVLTSSVFRHAILTAE